MLKYGEAIEQFDTELATLLTEEEYNQFIRGKNFPKKASFSDFNIILDYDNDNYKREY